MSEEGSLFHSLMVLWRIFTLRFKPNLGELLGPLIHAEEIAQIIPRYRDADFVSVSVLRQRVMERYGHDLVGELLTTPVFGEHTIESQARAVVRRYAESLPPDQLADQLMFVALQASRAAKRAYL